MLDVFQRVEHRIQEVAEPQAGSNPVNRRNLRERHTAGQLPANGGQIDNPGPSSAGILGCADLDVLRIRLFVLSEATIIETESDPILKAD